jgi:hypothetical protein
MFLLGRISFRFCNKDIAAVFDDPHSLQCKHNLFLKHVLTNVCIGVLVNGQRITGAAKWADILYKSDRVCCIICCIM